MGISMKTGQKYKSKLLTVINKIPLFQNRYVTKGGSIRR